MLTKEKNKNRAFIHRLYEPFCNLLALKLFLYSFTVANSVYIMTY